MSEPDRSLIDRTDEDLQQWLLDRAQSGVPELVLCGLLRSYADRIETTGYLSRMALPHDDSDERRHSD